MRRYLWIVIVTIIALAAGWWLGHGTAPSPGSPVAANANADAGSPGTNTRLNKPKRPSAHLQSRARTDMATPANPLPPLDMPLKQIFSELKARADAGDAEAASRLFGDARRCQRFRRLSRRAPQMAKFWLDEKTGNASPEDLEATDAFLSLAQSELGFLRSNAALCVDAPEEVDSTLPLALLAAQLGDPVAANCYVGGGGESGVPAGLIEHPEWLPEYKENALPLANMAIEQGDWTMVSQLAWAYRGDSSPNLLAQVTGRDTAMAYRYLKLALLGAPGADKEKAVRALQNRLNGFAGEITANQKAAADAWAQNAYQTYFLAHPNNTFYNSFRVCPADK